MVQAEYLNGDAGTSYFSRRSLLLFGVQKFLMSFGNGERTTVQCEVNHFHDDAGTSRVRGESPIP